MRGKAAGQPHSPVDANSSAGPALAPLGDAAPDPSLPCACTRKLCSTQRNIKLFHGHLCIHPVPSRHIVFNFSIHLVLDLKYSLLKNHLKKPNQRHYFGGHQLSISQRKDLGAVL